LHIPERQGHWRVVVDNLEQVQVLRDPAGRRLCLDLLADYLGFSLHVPESPVTRLHLFSIVLACRQYPRALAVFAEVVEELEPGTPAVRKVRQLLDDMSMLLDDMSTLDLVSEQDREELLRLLSGGVVEQLAELVRAAAGPIAAELQIDHHQPEEAVGLLEQLNARPDGVPPLLVFVEYLAKRIGDRRGGQLRDWNDRQARRMDIEDKVRAVRLEQVDPIAPHRSGELVAYIVIRLERDQFEPEEYLLTHWWQLDPGEWHPQRGEVFIGDLDRIRRQVAKLIEQAEAGWARKAANIRVDFMLPFELLNLPVDQWDLELDSGLPRPMGPHYQVVVRSLDRARTPKWHREWGRRWGALQELSRAEDMSCDEFWLWSTAAKSRQLGGLQATLAVREDVLSLVLRSPPADSSEVGEVLVGLRTGIPVMIWHRSDGARAAFEAEVASMRDELCRLPESTRQLRGRAKQSSRPDTHVGSRVTLMWDDPDRPVEPLDLPAAPNEEVPTS
jgi:hypothetical protein